MGLLKNSIKVERAKKNITQQQLAEEVNSTRQSIHYFESGKSEPTVSLAMKIARFFGIDINDLFNL